MTLDYRTYTRLEIRAALRTYHLWAAAALLAAGIGCGTLPLIPAVKGFFDAIFHTRDAAQVALMNDYAGLNAILYWTGVFDLLRIYILPREQRQLGLVLSKPISRLRYFVTKLAPTAVVLTGMALVAIGGFAAGVLLFAGTGFDPVALAATGLTVLALTLLMLAAANLLFLFAADTYTALLAAFAVFALVILPGGLYIYRPDLVGADQLARDVLVFPANLVWHQDSALDVTLVCTPLFLVATTGLTALAVARLRRTDVLRA